MKKSLLRYRKDQSRKTFSRIIEVYYEQRAKYRNIVRWGEEQTFRTLVLLANIFFFCIWAVKGRISTLTFVLIFFLLF